MVGVEGEKYVGVGFCCPRCNVTAQRRGTDSRDRGRISGHCSVILKGSHVAIRAVSCHPLTCFQQNYISTYIPLT